MPINLDENDAFDTLVFNLDLQHFQFQGEMYIKCNCIHSGNTIEFDNNFHILHSNR